MTNAFGLRRVMSVVSAFLRGANPIGQQSLNVVSEYSWLFSKGQPALESLAQGVGGCDSQEIRAASWNAQPLLESAYESAEFARAFWRSHYGQVP